MADSRLSWVVVKPPPNSFFRAISSHPDRDKIDPAKALRQHRDFQETLEELVERLVVMKPNELHPDSCFVEDTALVLGPVGIVGRSGIGVRNAETAAAEKVLHKLVEEVKRIPPPGSVEGGDVLRIGKRLVVGRSRRTSDHGIDALARIVEPLGYNISVVDVPSGLVHLSTGVTVLSDRMVIGMPELLRHPVFQGLEQVHVEKGPLAACNVLGIGDHVIASGDYEDHDKLEKKGFILHRLDLGEFVKADGGPTCLTLRPR